MYISLQVQKIFGKIKCSFIIKNLGELGLEDNFLNFIRYLPNSLPYKIVNSIKQ